MQSIRVAELKARLSEQLRSVKRGETITVLERDTPVARIVPMSEAGAALRFVAGTPQAVVRRETAAAAGDEGRHRGVAAGGAGRAMTAYVDSSVVLRVLLGQQGRLAEWKQITKGVSSALLEVECLRTLDRLRLARGVSEVEIALRREAVYEVMEALEVVELGRTVMGRAAQPMPVQLGTLDAIHLSTAMLWRERTGEELHGDP
jgi:prevent-host-death family protein